jgi:hypothetical protein
LPDSRCFASGGFAGREAMTADSLNGRNGQDGECP